MSAKANPATARTARAGRAASAPIYLDHHATTPLDERVLEAMQPYLHEDFGNAASTTHVFGWRAAAAVDDARERIAALLEAEASEVVFTSGATESNNLALLGAMRASRERRRIVTLETEHPAVIDPVHALEREGFDVCIAAVGGDGKVDLAELRRAVDEGTRIVSVMSANNEIGVLQPMGEIAELCAERGAWLHSDAAQAAGKVPLERALDLVSISGHKIYGPKGIGALVVRKRRPRIRLEPLQYGGGHEGGLRSGTLPVAAIVGLARALELCCEERESEARRLAALRDRLHAAICAGLPEAAVVLNGHPRDRLPGNLNLSFRGVDGDRLLLGLPELAVSSGSACSSAHAGPSHVLLALGHDEALAQASLRFGLGRGSDEAGIDFAAERVVAAVHAQLGSAGPAGSTRAAG